MNRFILSSLIAQGRKSARVSILRNELPTALKKYKLTVNIETLVNSSAENKVTLFDKV